MEELIVLTGFMGVGKSAVAAELADMLGWRAVDLDEVIEGRVGKSIEEIFSDEGEPFFRSEETRALTETLKDRRIVLATGGGVVKAEENRKLLSEVLTVNLNAPLALCANRLEGSGIVRPLLKGDDAQQKMRSIYEERRVFYEEIDNQIDTEELGPRQIARRIIEEFMKGEGAGLKD